MSIWSSAEGDEIRALENSSEATNYRAEGEPGLIVDVATAASFHDHIRLAIWSDGRRRVDVDVLLSPAAARELHRQLGAALFRRFR